jgi:hypothetical protein
MLVLAGNQHFFLDTKRIQHKSWTCTPLPFKVPLYQKSAQHSSAERKKQINTLNAGNHVKSLLLDQLF